MGTAIDRRTFHRLSLGTVAGVAASPWAGALAARAGNQLAQSGRHCVILWMAGGPSQIDTFDMKPQHANGGSLKETATAVPGMRFSEHLPELAKLASHLSIVRSLSTREGDHERGTALMRTGHPLGGPVPYPAIGSSLSKSLDDQTGSLPPYISIGSSGGFGMPSPGFLGPKYAAMPVQGQPPAGDDAFADLSVNNLQLPRGVSPERFSRRMDLLAAVGRDRYRAALPTAIAAHQTQYSRASRVLRSQAGEAFDLDQEPDDIRRAYGNGIFGQGCLLARRLIERGVRIVEVTLGQAAGWDTHADNFDTVPSLCGELDAGWSSLLRELEERGLLASTTFLWVGEFGRTPQINNAAGRDHFPNAWSCVLGGAGIQGGSVFGATTADGMEIADKPVNEQDILTTLCRALGINPRSENITPEGRPIMISEGNAIEEILA